MQLSLCREARSVRPRISGGEMTFDETLYLGDDEMDEYGDRGSYGESLDEDLEEEEEEEEESGMPGEAEPASEPYSEPAPVTSGGGGGGESKAAKKKPAAK